MGTMADAAPAADDPTPTTLETAAPSFVVVVRRSGSSAEIAAAPAAAPAAPRVAHTSSAPSTRSRGS
jgi:hypothetical protein